MMWPMGAFARAIEEVEGSLASALAAALAWSACEGTSDCDVGSCALRTTSRTTLRGVF